MRWKQAERKVANTWGTKRVPLSGSNSGHGTSSDTMHTELYIEVKNYKSPAIAKLWGKTYLQAQAESKVAVVCHVIPGIPGALYTVHESDLDVLSKLVPEKIGKRSILGFVRRFLSGKDSD